METNFSRGRRDEDAVNRSLHEIAAEVCAWVEKREEREDVGVWLSRILAELIQVVYSIPDDGLWDAGDCEEDNYKARDYQEVRNSLPNLPLQYYSEVYDSTVLDDNDCERRIARRCRRYL